MQRLFHAWLGSALAMGALGCAVAVEDAGGDTSFEKTESRLPELGADGVLELATWNLDWFATEGFGPEDDVLQRHNVQDVLEAARVDLWAIEEVPNDEPLEALVRALPHYAGFTTRDPFVEGGRDHYYRGEQALALVYRESVVSVRAARIILGDHEQDFGGRPPLEVEITVQTGEEPLEMVLVVLHAKARGDFDSWARRRRGAEALKAYLDEAWPTGRVVVLGDFNDDLDRSVRRGEDSPYVTLVRDRARYQAPTLWLSTNRIGTTIGGTDPIDHIVHTREMGERALETPPEVVRLDDLLLDYAHSTSNHLPVLTRYSLAPPTRGGQGPLVINEVLANEPNGDTALEFVEIVNASTEAVNLGGMTLEDRVGVRHEFGDDLLGPGKATVIFGAALLDQALGTDAILGLASSGALGLNNGGDCVVLRDAARTKLDELCYDGALGSSDGVSITRAVDGDPDAPAVLHSTLGPLLSPAHRTDLTAF